MVQALTNQKCPTSQNNEYQHKKEYQIKLIA